MCFMQRSACPASLSSHNITPSAREASGQTGFSMQLPEAHDILEALPYACSFKKCMQNKKKNKFSR